MQRRWRGTFPERIAKYPAVKKTALTEFRAALTVGRSETGIKSLQEMSGRSIRIKKTQRTNGVRAIMPRVVRSNLRCMK